MQFQNSMQVEAQPINTTESKSKANAEEEEQQDKLVDIQIPEGRKQYGNLIVLFRCRWFMISMGPDYLCFLPAFAFFAVLGYLLCRTVSTNIENQNVVLFTYGISLLQCGSYLMVALSTPAIAKRQNNPITVVTERNAHRVCRKCGAQKKRKTYHCRDCDVCIEGYDHHCPWVSKCIGRGNLWLFYVFVTVTPIYILCFMGLMMGSLVTMAATASKNARQHIRPSHQ